MNIIDRIHLSAPKHAAKKDPNKNVHFITFTNTGYIEPTRILQEANEFNFQSMRALNEHDIPEFIEKHSQFIRDNPLGYGRWIWKPKIILDSLRALKDDDILLYCDAGFHLNIHGINRYYDYLTMMNTTDLLTFSCNDNYTAQQHVKRIAIEAYHPEFAHMKHRYCYAGIMMVKKTQASIRVLEDWLMLCETYQFLDGSRSMYELPVFLGNDSDNGLFNLCLAKHNISHAIYPDETNIYDTFGFQYHTHDPKMWVSLRRFPFQCRRIRPPR